MGKHAYKPGARLPLPWEREQSRLRSALSGHRFMPLLGPLLVVFALFAAYRIGGQRADVRATRAMLAEVESATRAFAADLGRCPDDVSELVNPPKSGMQYLSEPPLDAWGRAPHLSCESGERALIEVVSAGPSGSFLDDDNVM
jgi:hypothetical protein